MHFCAEEEKWKKEILEQKDMILVEEFLISTFHLGGWLIIGGVNNYFFPLFEKGKILNIFVADTKCYMINFIKFKWKIGFIVL